MVPVDSTAVSVRLFYATCHLCTGLARQMHFVTISETVLHLDQQRRNAALAEQRKHVHEFETEQARVSKT